MSVDDTDYNNSVVGHVPRKPATRFLQSTTKTRRRHIESFVD